MAVRDYKDLSAILKKVALRLLASQELCKLLYYTDTDPLSHNDFDDTTSLLGDVLRVKPRVGPQETTKSKVVLVLPGAEKGEENKEIIQLPVQIFVYVPYEEWIIKGDDLRVFLIMSKIEELLDGKQVNGIGKFDSKDFEMVLTTDEMCAYRMGFVIDVFS